LLFDSRGARFDPEPIKSAAEVIVRWGLAELSGLLDKVGMRCPFVVASNRWSHLDLPGAARWSEEPLYTAVVSARGGRDGRVRGTEPPLDLPLATPRSLGGPGWHALRITVHESVTQG